MTPWYCDDLDMMCISYSLRKRRHQDWEIEKNNMQVNNAAWATTGKTVAK
jgi:hypothetical protein